MADRSLPDHRDDALTRLLEGLIAQSSDLDRLRTTLRVTGNDPVVPSSFRIGTAAVHAITASAMMAAELHCARTGIEQEIAIDLADAVTEFRSERYLRIGDGPAPALWDPIAGAYPCKDGRFVRIHTNFPHHRDGILDLLGCRHDRAAVAAALRSWEGRAFERAALDTGQMVALMRSFEEWDATDQARATRGQPLVDVTRIDDTPASPLDPGSRPLSGIRVLEMTRIIAGPVCGRTLASHGADVLRLIGRGAPTIDALDIDTGHGKRSAYLDLRAPADREQLEALLMDADVFLHSCRPGALDAYGLDMRAVTERHPGLIYASLSAYGPAGPWARKRGFDSLVQTVTGFNDAEAEAFGSREPKALPAQVLDHATGHFLAAGIMAALARRSKQGGSWAVHASLARTALWLRNLGRLPKGAVCEDLAERSAKQNLEAVPSPHGSLIRVRPAARLSQTPIRFDRTSTPYGFHSPQW